MCFENITCSCLPTEIRPFTSMCDQLFILSSLIGFSFFALYLKNGNFITNFKFVLSIKFLLKWDLLQVSTFKTSWDVIFKVMNIFKNSYFGNQLFSCDLLDINFFIILIPIGEFWSYRAAKWLILSRILSGTYMPMPIAPYQQCGTFFLKMSQFFMQFTILLTRDWYDSKLTDYFNHSKICFTWNFYFKVYILFSHSIRYSLKLISCER